MDWDLYIFAGAFVLMGLFAGLILLIVNDALERRRDRQMMRFIGKDLICKGKRAVVEAIGESMDMMPEKIMEVKRTIEGG